MSIATSFGNGFIGRQNAAANTVVYTIIPGGSTYRSGIPYQGNGQAQAMTCLINFQATSLSTANSIYIMRAIGRTTSLTTAAANTVAALTLAGDPSPSGNTISAGDQCVIEGTDGYMYRNQVNTAGWCSTTNVVTFTANVVPAVTNGSKVYFMGVFTDTDPVTGQAFPYFNTTANTTTNFPPVVTGAFVQTSARIGEPLLIYNPNSTDATALPFIFYGYSLQG